MGGVQPGWLSPSKPAELLHKVVSAAPLERFCPVQSRRSLSQAPLPQFQSGPLLSATTKKTSLARVHQIRMVPPRTRLHQTPAECVRDVWLYSLSGFAIVDVMDWSLLIEDHDKHCNVVGTAEP